MPAHDTPNHPLRMTPVISDAARFGSHRTRQGPLRPGAGRVAAASRS